MARIVLTLGSLPMRIDTAFSRLLWLWLALTAAAGAAQPIPVGVLYWHESPNDPAAIHGLKEGIAATGRPFHLIVRHAGSDPERAKQFLREFKGLGVRLVVALGTEATRIAADELKDTDIPLVFTAVTDPVSSGIVPSWRGSGSFIAGNSNHIDPNRVLTDFRSALPGLKTLGVLHSPDNRVSRAEIEGLQAALKKRASLGVRLLPRTVQAPDKLPAATDALLAECDALWIPIDYAVYSRLDVVAAAARRFKKPLVTTTRKAVPEAVVAVLPDYHTLGMLAVEIIDRVLRQGVEPGAIPVGVMQGRILVINLEAARHAGIEVPIRALAAADRIIPEKKNR